MCESPERLSWTTIDGGMRLNAEASDRRWTLVHTRYAFCVLNSGAADWNYRGRRFTVTPGKVYVLEPGEVHTTLRAHGPGEYSVSFLDSDWISRFGMDLADIPQPHFAAEGVEAPDGWRGLMEASKVDPATDREEFSERLSLSLAAVLRSEVGHSRPQGFRSTLARAKRGLMERYLSAPDERIHLGEVVRELGVGYHRFVHDFSLQFGAAPYQFVKMLRAGYVLDRLRTGPSAEIPSLTALAIHAGYCDMPHLSREMRLHFGGTPREIARQLNPDWVKRAPNGQLEA